MWFPDLKKSLGNLGRTIAKFTDLRLNNINQVSFIIYQWYYLLFSQWCWKLRDDSRLSNKSKLKLKCYFWKNLINLKTNFAGLMIRYIQKS